MGGSEQVGQDEIEDLLRQAQAAAQGGKPAAPARAPSEPQSLGQDEIEALLAGSGPAAPSMAASAPSPAVATAPPPPPQRPTTQPSSQVGDDIQFLLAQAEQAIASVDQPIDPAIAGIAPFAFRDLASAPPSGEKATLELLRDVDLDLRIELGRTEMYLEDVLKLRRGSVVTLDKLAGDPVDIYVNGRLIARGEVLVLNDNFCVRVAELLSGDDFK